MDRLYDEALGDYEHFAKDNLPPTPERLHAGMELLIVISIMLILMLMAIPNFNKMRITAHETSAINSLRTIYTAQIQYQTAYPSNGYSCALQSLGGDPKSGQNAGSGNLGTAVAGRPAGRHQGRLHVYASPTAARSR